MDTKRILFISQEIFPYVPETLESTIARYLPQYAYENGYEVRIFMPCFGNINERRNQLHEVQRLSGLNLIINETDHQLIIKVASIQTARIQIYFIDNYDFFYRKSMDRDEQGKAFTDNDERVIFYNRGVLETIKKLRWVPDIVHCSGWFSSIAPLLIKKAHKNDTFFKNSKIIYSINNDYLKFTFSKQIEKKLMIDKVVASDLKLLKTGDIDWEMMIKLGIDNSDGLIINSPDTPGEWQQYAEKTNLPFRPYQDDYKANAISLYKEILN
jgi:starch synthase